jgi:hypothetical protein
VSSQGSYCLKNCTYNGGQGDCRTGYVCDRNLIPNSAQHTCVSACTSAADCGGTLGCWNGFCCGAVGYRCCNGTTCQGGATCSNGYCQ